MQHRNGPDPELEALIERVARRAAEHAVRDAFHSIHLDLDDASSVRDLAADMHWTRRARIGSESVSFSIKRIIAIAAVIGTAVSYTIWTLLKNPPPN